MADAIAVIPARYASVRFPGKVLADRTGRPLIQHVYERAAAAGRVGRVIVAADDSRIVDAVRGFGGEAVLTRTDHANGTSRIAEVAPTFDADLVVNVQGDEPEIEPGLIDLAIERLEAHPDCVASTLGSPFTDEEDPADPNIVKVVVSTAGLALYFSRCLIPYDRDGTGAVRVSPRVPADVREPAADAAGARGAPGAAEDSRERIPDGRGRRRGAISRDRYAAAVRGVCEKNRD
jgi:3-deoxy-manno-octulosonate cytidylyltransferase (CMP-KDO synthetase)